jgi:hypothetical protein
VCSSDLKTAVERGWQWPSAPCREPGVAVGTIIADRPPHRPVLALLTHTVPTLEIAAPGLSVRTWSLGIVVHRCSLALCPASAHAWESPWPTAFPPSCSADSPLPLFADFIGTMRSLDSPPPCMRDLSLIAFSLRPANCSRAATGSPGSRA